MAQQRCMCGGARSAKMAAMPSPTAPKHREITSSAPRWQALTFRAAQPRSPPPSLKRMRRCVKSSGLPCSLPLLQVQPSGNCTHSYLLDGVFSIVLNLESPALRDALVIHSMVYSCYDCPLSCLKLEFPICLWHTAVCKDMLQHASKLLPYLREPHRRR